jgi:hypothetical protein
VAGDNAAGGINSIDSARYFNEAARKCRGKIKAHDAARANPDVSIGGVNEFRCGVQESNQQTSLENHEEYSERNSDRGDHEPQAVVQNVFPA